MITESQTKNFLSVSGYDNYKVEYKEGELKLHRIGSEYQIEYWEKGDFSHIVKGGFFDRFEAMGKMVDMKAEL